MTSPDAVLQKLPKNTPLWAVGAVSIFVSFALCLVSMYIVVRPEVQTYLSEGYKIQDKKSDADTLVISNVLGIVKANSEQISNLSASLVFSQRDNIRLTERVATLEKELAITKASLKEYESRVTDLRRIK